DDAGKRRRRAILRRFVDVARSIVVGRPVDDRRHEAVTPARHGDDASRPVTAVAQCPPQARQLHAQIRLVDESVWPDLRDQIVLADDFACSPDEREQDIHCPAADDHRHIAVQQKVLRRKEAERSELEGRPAGWQRVFGHVDPTWPVQARQYRPYATVSTSAGPARLRRFTSINWNRPATSSNARSMNTRTEHIIPLLPASTLACWSIPR